jgi:purine-binding chemotaxis protein CheW
MDIAKIRKKLKETETSGSQQPRVNDKPTEGHEAQGIKSDKENAERRTLNSEGIKAEADTNQKADAKRSEEIRTERVDVKEEITKAKDIEKKIEENKTDEIIEILTFSLLKEEFAFRISELEEIRRYQRITMVPKMPNYVLGITSLRGKVIPVIDLKTKLSLTDKPSDIDHKGKILIIKGPKGPIGAAIDKVLGVVRITKTDILPPPSHLTETELKFVEGVAVVDKRFISIMRMEEAIKI